MSVAAPAPDFAAPADSVGAASFSVPNINSATGLTTD